MDTVLIILLGVLIYYICFWILPKYTYYLIFLPIRFVKYKKQYKKWKKNDKFEMTGYFEYDTFILDLFDSNGNIALKNCYNNNDIICFNIIFDISKYSNFKNLDYYNRLNQNKYQKLLDKIK